MGPGEQICNRIEGQLSNIGTSLKLLIVILQKMLIFQLPKNLISRPNESNPIDTGHDGLLDGLPLDLPPQLLRQLMIFALRVCNIPIDGFYHHVCYVGVHVAWPFVWAEVYLVCAFGVPAQGCVVLQAVAGTVLVDVQVRYVLFRVFTF